MNTCQVFKKIRENLLDILLPRLCLGCGREGAYICKNCEVFLSEVDPLLKFVEVRLQQVQQMPEIVSVWEYEGIIEKAIHKIKYNGSYDIIDELMERAMKKIELNLPEDTIITHVPMWPKKERQRGFNQSELIARQLVSELQPTRLKLQPRRLLEKTRDNGSQVGLGPRERAENVRGVFRMRREREARLPAGSLASTDERNVLLVDDVYTTGATMGECMKVLKKAGVKNVWGFTLARKLSL